MLRRLARYLLLFYELSPVKSKMKGLSCFKVIEGRLLTVQGYEDDAGREPRFKFD